MSDLVSLELDGSLWERVQAVAPLVLVGTREPGGSVDFAPKHRVLALSARHFAFVCRETHATYRNATREECFTVSWPGPQHIVMSSAAAAPRCEDGEKRSMRALPTLPARSVDGELVEGCRFHLECRLDRVIEDLDLDDVLVVGRIEAAYAEPGVLRGEGASDEALLREHPLLAYLHPTQFAVIEHGVGFPFAKGFTRS